MSAPTLPRRDFLGLSAVAGSGLALGIHLPPSGRFAETQQDAPLAPNAFVRVARDGAVTVVVGYSEMGQGILTALPMLVAEELEVDPTTVRFEQAPASAEYNNPMFGAQGTGGSTTVRACWEPMRKAGAAAREMLMGAAAQQWNVPRAELTAENGTVRHAASNRTAGYGTLVEAASRQPVPQTVELKPSSSWKVLGKRIRRLDAPLKVTGRAAFGVDARVPGMLTAVVARCPVFGGRLAGFSRNARSVAGVRHVVELPSGVGVVADGYWAAKKGRDALNVRWEEGAGAAVTSDTIRARWVELVRQQGLVARQAGDVETALRNAPRRLEAVYETPYLAHACMEPMNCTAHVRADSVELWAPTQFQGVARTLAAQLAGVPESAVKVNTTMLGGGFGRRFESDFIADAVLLSKAAGAPVKLIYSREDDIQHDFYRPATYNVLSAGLDAAGNPVAWTYRSVSSSIMSRAFPQFVREGRDESAFEGAELLEYAVPNVRAEWVRDEPGVPVGFWRSVGSSHTAFVKESFLDEIAAASRTDPLELRRRLLAGKTRWLGVLNAAAERAGWGSPLPAGRARGIAVHESFASWAAQVAEVSLNADGTPRVHRIVCAIDCGQTVNPLTIEAQVQSAIVYGLSAALHNAITIDRGRVVQSNFHDYPALRMNEMPRVDVVIIPSTEAPGGVGEPATPPVAPAVCNALFALTGRRVRRLPIRAEDLRQG